MKRGSIEETAQANWCNVGGIASGYSHNVVMMKTLAFQEQCYACGPCNSLLGGNSFAIEVVYLRNG